MKGQVSSSHAFHIYCLRKSFRQDVRRWLVIADQLVGWTAVGTFERLSARAQW